MPTRGYIMWLAVFTALLAGPVGSAQVKPPPEQPSSAQPASAQPASAQPASAQRPALGVSFGWDGRSLVAERWSPVVITLDSGAEAIDGLLRIEYRQDHSQDVRLLQQVATTPGRSVRIEALVCVPRNIEEISVFLLSPTGERLAVERFGGTSPRAAPLPVILGGDDLPVVAIGERVGLKAEVIDKLASRPRGADSLPSGAGRVIQRSPTDLPAASAAYQGLMFAVIDAAAIADIEPRALTALREWVLSGGCAVVLSRGATPTWRALLPPGPAGELVRGLEPRIDAPPSQLIDELRMLATDPESNKLAASQPQRPMALTDRGLAEGWRLRWSVNGPNEGLLAEGPVGMGWLSILGADPVQLADAFDGRTTNLAWQAALTIDWPVTNRPRPSGDYASSSHASASSGATPSEQAAVRRTLDAVSDVPPLSDWIFVVISAAAVLLGLMLGVGDYFILGRKHRRNSWATALGWITLASLAALIGPEFLGRGDTRLNRLTMIDLLMPAGDERPLAFQSAVTSLWSGARARANFVRAGTDPQAFDPAGPGLLWRGVSSLDLRGAESNPFGAVVDVIARPTPNSPADQWGGLAPGTDASATVAPGGMRTGSWTLRSFTDSGRAAPSILAAIGPGTAGGATVVRLGPLDPGVVARSATLRYKHGYYSLKFEPEPGTGESVTLVADVPPNVEWSLRTPWMLMSAEDLQPGFFSTPYASGRIHSGAFRPGHVLDLPTVAARTRASEERLRSGRWAMILVELTKLPLDVRLSDRPQTGGTRTVILRALVPVEPGWISEPPPAPTDQPAPPSADEGELVPARSAPRVARPAPPAPPPPPASDKGSP